MYEAVMYLEGVLLGCAIGIIVLKTIYDYVRYNESKN
jgi:hypothetical protein